LWFSGKQCAQRERESIAADLPINATLAGAIRQLGVSLKPPTKVNRAVLVVVMMTCASVLVDLAARS
jgi:hypothetical protein